MLHLLDKSGFRDGVVAVGVELPKNVRESLQHEGCVFDFHLPPEVRVLASAFQGLVDKHSGDQVEERQGSEDNVDHQEGTVHCSDAVQDHQHVVPVNAAEDHHEQRKHGHGERPKEATHVLDIRICVGRIRQVLCGTVHEGQRKEEHGHGEDQDGPQKHHTGTGDRGRHRVELRDAGREAQETEEAKGPENLHDAEHAEDREAVVERSQPDLGKRQQDTKEVKEIPLPILREKTGVETQDPQKEFNGEEDIEQDVSSVDPSRKFTDTTRVTQLHFITVDGQLHGELTGHANEDCIQTNHQSHAGLEAAALHDAFQSTQGEHAVSDTLPLRSSQRHSSSGGS
mmetsp:Transcript_28478/g.75182  ORF Transcript_28478/g.75182 Transcript_28478/m.75182 type:complete len:341 (-) Transcript_28478:773-1795(-)